ncbi:MAG: FlgD immunoglobulin-like domain containing protein [bacterium]
MAWLLAGMVSFAGAQKLSINGDSEHVAEVGDILKLQYFFTTGASEATAEVWLDLDHDGSVSRVDYLVFQTHRRDEMLIDGGLEDEDGKVDGEFNAAIDDFFPLAPADYIFVVTDRAGSAQAILRLNQPASRYSVSGTVIVPAITENLFVLAVPAFFDSTGFKTSGKKILPEKWLPINIFSDDRDDCEDRKGPGDDDFDPQDIFLATMTDRAGGFVLSIPDDFPMAWYMMVLDQFGVIHGYFPPPPQKHVVDRAITGLEFAFLPANSQITGRIHDLLGAPLTNELGEPLETEVHAFDEFGAHQTTHTTGGQFAMDVLPGKYHIEVGDLFGLYLTPPGQPAQVIEHDTVKVDFPLARLDNGIHGKVTFSDGRPAPCIEIFGMGPNGEYTRTRSQQDGAYWLPASSQLSPWFVAIEEFSLPPFVEVEEPIRKQAEAGDGGVDFVLIEFDAAPHILHIDDVEHDQGLQVRVVWQGSAFDKPADFEGSHSGPPGMPITQYSLWRRGPELPPVTGPGKTAANKNSMIRVASIEKMFARRNSVQPGARFKVDNDHFLWDFITSVPALQFGLYSHVAPTLHDSTAASLGWSHFLVVAHTSDPFQHYFSLPDSGYSKDNIAPELLAAKANMTASGVEIAWQIADAPDVVSVAIYRGETNGFSPERAIFNGLVNGSNRGTYLDAAGTSGNFYRIILTDDAGNQTISEEINPLASGIVDRTQGNAIPEEFILDQNYPNPFNPSTKIAFGLPQAGPVKLEIFDLAGKRIATLVNTALPAGYYETTWAGMDRFGNALPSGVYIYYLQSNAEKRIKKMTLVK